MAMPNSYGCRPGIIGLLAPDLKAQDPSQIATVPSAKTGGPPITDCAGCACGCAGGKSDVITAIDRVNDAVHLGAYALPGNDPNQQGLLNVWDSANGNLLRQYALPKVDALAPAPVLTPQLSKSGRWQHLHLLRRWLAGELQPPLLQQYTQRQTKGGDFWCGRVSPGDGSLKPVVTSAINEATTSDATDLPLSLAYRPGQCTSEN